MACRVRVFRLIRVELYIRHTRRARRLRVARVSNDRATGSAVIYHRVSADSLGSICENSVPGIRERKHDVSSETWPSYRSVDPGISKLLNVSQRLSDRDSDVNVFQTRFRAISRLEYRRSALHVTVDFAEIYERRFRDDSNGEYNFRECTSPKVGNGIPLRRVWNFYVFLGGRIVCRSLRISLQTIRNILQGRKIEARRKRRLL